MVVSNPPHLDKVPHIFTVIPISHISIPKTAVDAVPTYYNDIALLKLAIMPLELPLLHFVK
jgi:hypothetical protein